MQSSQYREQIHSFISNIRPTYTHACGAFISPPILPTRGRVRKFSAAAELHARGAHRALSACHTYASQLHIAHALRLALTGVHREYCECVYVCAHLPAELGRMRSGPGIAYIRCQNNNTHTLAEFTACPRAATTATKTTTTPTIHTYTRTLFPVDPLKTARSRSYIYWPLWRLWQTVLTLLVRGCECVGVFVCVGCSFACFFRTPLSPVPIRRCFVHSANRLRSRCDKKP